MDLQVYLILRHETLMKTHRKFYHMIWKDEALYALHMSLLMTHLYHNHYYVVARNHELHH